MAGKLVFINRSNGGVPKLPVPECRRGVIKVGDPVTVGTGAYAVVRTPGRNPGA